MLSALAAAHLGAGLTADCTALGLDDAGETEESGTEPALLQIRPALGGNILATIVSTLRGAGLPEMATVRSGVFPLRSYPDLPAIAAEDMSLRVAAPPAELIRSAEFRGRQASERRPGVDPDAEVIVAVGAGIGGPERLEGLVLPLRDALATHLDTRVSLACSRAVVDAGILPYEYQIGQTGKSVRPSLYIALGISGAIQHRLGMERSARVLAINPDDGAPIHAISDYSVIATIEEAVPLLLRAARG
jgi:electron transfer flavoprotein alpha subunit